MQFTPIDMKTWPRAQVFTYFAQMAPTGYSLTVDVDVTRLHRTVKAEGLKFFPAYLWLVTKELNRQPEFRLAERDGVLGTYDTLTPLYAAFHDDDHTFSFQWTEYTDAFALFYHAYLAQQAACAGVHALLSRPEVPPPNAYTVSCVPWIRFTHFSVQSYENKPYYFPSVEAGKFEEKEGRLLMPLSLTCHHAATDGYHVRLFLEALQEDMDSFGRFL